MTTKPGLSTPAFCSACSAALLPSGPTFWRDATSARSPSSTRSPYPQGLALLPFRPGPRRGLWADASLHTRGDGSCLRAGRDLRAYGRGDAGALHRALAGCGRTAGILPPDLPERPALHQRGATALRAHRASRDDRVGPRGPVDTA